MLISHQKIVALLCVLLSPCLVNANNYVHIYNQLPDAVEIVVKEKGLFGSVIEKLQVPGNAKLVAVAVAPHIRKVTVTGYITDEKGDRKQIYKEEVAFKDGADEQAQTAILNARSTKSYTSKHKPEKDTAESADTSEKSEIKKSVGAGAGAGAGAASQQQVVRNRQATAQEKTAAEKEADERVAARKAAQDKRDKELTDKRAEIYGV